MTIGNGNDNPALTKLDAIGTARGAYHAALEQSKAAVDQLVRWFFAQVDEATTQKWSFSHVTSGGEEPDFTHVQLRVDFRNGVWFDEECYQTPEAFDDDEIDDWEQRVADIPEVVSGLLDELYHHLSDNLDVLSRVFPDAEHVVIARPADGAKFTYAVKDAGDQTLRKIKED